MTPTDSPLPASLSALQDRLRDLRAQGQILLQNGDRGFGTAPSNIALIKYWGKHSDQQPQNSNLSLNLGSFRATTEVVVRGRFYPQGSAPALHSNTVLFAGMTEPAPADRKLDRWISRVFADWASEIRMHVRSENNFPSACGVASSAAGYAALAAAVADLLQLERHFSATELQTWLTEWARLGSGSAARSAIPGAAEFVAWERDDVDGSFAHPVPASPGFELGHCLLVLDTSPKSVSSSEGHEAARHSPFFAVRAAGMERRFRAMCAAVAAGDFSTVATLAEEDAFAIHAIMQTSEPASRHLDSRNSQIIARFVAGRDQARVPAFWTLDAGPNVHILFLREALPFVRDFLARECAGGGASVLWGGKGPGALPGSRARAVVHTDLPDDRAFRMGEPA